MKKNRRWPDVLGYMVVSVVLCGLATASASQGAGERVDWQVISGGGARVTSPGYVINGTIGQTAVETSTSAAFRLHQGYWQNFASASCCTTPGDANNDDLINVGDAVFIVNYIFKGGDAPPCPEEADANCDVTINVGDAVYIINYVFKGGPDPCCP